MNENSSDNKEIEEITEDATPREEKELWANMESQNENKKETGKEVL